MDPNHSTHKPETGNQRRKTPRGKPDQRLGKLWSNKNSNRRETTNVPRKRSSEGQTRTKTHHHGKLLRGTQLHGYTRNDNDHIMVKIQLHGEKESVTINAMIDSGATKDFIDREVCNKHGIKMIKAKNPREIYFADENQVLWDLLPICRKYLWTLVALGNWQPSKWQISKTMRSFSGCHG